MTNLAKSFFVSFEKQVEGYCRGFELSVIDDELFMDVRETDFDVVDFRSRLILWVRNFGESLNVFGVFWGIWGV